MPQFRWKNQVAVVAVQKLIVAQWNEKPNNWILVTMFLRKSHSQRQRKQQRIRGGVDRRSRKISETDSDDADDGDCGGDEERKKKEGKEIWIYLFNWKNSFKTYYSRMEH